MLRTIRKENPELVRTLIELRRASRANSAPIWGAVAERLNRPRHQTTPLNVGHLERLAEANDTVVVAGKLLAHGEIGKPITVAAWGYSGRARQKIHGAGGKALTIEELIKAKPDGSGVRLLA
ncbi:MAG: 50S ribosomal protein L18e [Thermoplasmata archaeon]|nr:50S ribosomal protein L18e [Thermoplasmata archaeon]